MALIDQMKTRIDEVVGKNRQLEEENKTLTLKLKNSEGQVDDLHAKIRDLEAEIKILKSVMNTGEKKDFSDFSSALELEKENKLLRLEFLELTVKYQMRKMWKMILLELQDNPPRTNSMRGKQGKIKCNSERTVEQIVSTVSTVIPSQKDSSETNPLENEKIVRHIMGYVKAEDLLNCRQVCKLWKKATQKDLEEKATFHIRNRKNQLFRIPMFMDCADKSFPMFRNLKLELDCSSYAVLIDKKDTSGLFLKHGKHLHKLQLEFGENGTYGESWSLEDFRATFLNSLEEIRELHIHMSCRLIHQDRLFLSHHVQNTLTKLTTLNIGLNCGTCRYTHHENTQVFIDLLGLIPNLKVLYWGSWGVNGIYGSINFIHSLLHVCPSKLEKLFILSFIPDFLVAAIAYSHFNLNQLGLYDVQSFKLHLVSSAYGKSEVVPRITPYFSGNMDPALKTHLENTLAQYGNVSCTGLLHVFMNTLSVAIQRGRVRINQRNWGSWTED